MGVIRNFDLSLHRPVFRRDIYGQDALVGLPPIRLSVQIPDWDELAGMIDTGRKPSAHNIDKSRLQLLEDAILSVFFEHAQTIANSDQELTTDTFPSDDLQWDSLSAMHSGSRWRRAALTTQMAALMDDYVIVMPVITGKAVERVNLAAMIMLSDFEQVTHDKKSIAIIRDQLVTYAEQAPNALQHIDAIAYLLYRIDVLLDLENIAVIDPSDL